MACRPAGSSTVLSLPIHIYCRCWILCCWLCACTPSSFASVPSGVSVPGFHPPPRVLTFHRALQFEYMDPDEATKLTLVNIDLVAQWAGIEGDRQDNTTVRGSLFLTAGMQWLWTTKDLGTAASWWRTNSASYLAHPTTSTCSGDTTIYDPTWPSWGVLQDMPFHLRHPSGATSGPITTDCTGSTSSDHWPT